MEVLFVQGEAAALRTGANRSLSVRLLRVHTHIKTQKPEKADEISAPRVASS